VQKIAPTKLSKYLQCFWKDSKLADTSAAATSCMKTVGINAAQVTTCVSEAKKQFSPTEKAMGLNKEEALQFGVQGSPTLVINGTTVASGRDSASVLKAICSGFTTQPKACQAQLPATSPAAGFTDQALAGGASAAACGN
jgi:predicted DsbA family dithiol-disulfide isomerase